MSFEPAIAGRVTIYFWCAANVDAEFVFTQTGRNVGMSLGEYVGIYAQGEPRFDLQLAGSRGKQLEFGFALHIELKNACSESEVDFGSCFSNTRKDHPFCGTRCSSNYALQ